MKQKKSKLMNIKSYFLNVLFSANIELETQWVYYFSRILHSNSFSFYANMERQMQRVFFNFNVYWTSSPSPSNYQLCVSSCRHDYL